VLRTTQLGSLFGQVFAKESALRTPTRDTQTRIKCGEHLILGYPGMPRCGSSCQVFSDPAAQQLTARRLQPLAPL
jgi:hypothetical protein